jgi:hypothetical protein
MATWNITNCKYTNAVSGVTDKSKIIVGAYWKCTATSGGSVEGYSDIYATDFDNWKDWNSVTESDVVSWVKNMLGAEEVTRIETESSKKDGLSLPW